MWALGVGRWVGQREFHSANFRVLPMWVTSSLGHCVVSPLAKCGD